MEIELQVVGRRFEDFFVRNKGSKDKHEQDLIKKQLDDNQDIISNLGVNPRKLIKEWQWKAEAYDTNSSLISLSQENKQLKEELKTLRNTGAFYLKETSKLREQVKRELKDNNGLRKYNTNMFQQLGKIKNWYGRIQGQVTDKAALEMVQILKDK